MTSSLTLGQARQQLRQVLEDWELEFLGWPLPAGEEEPPLWASRVEAAWSCSNPEPLSPLFVVIELPHGWDYLQALQDLRSQPEWLVVVLLDPHNWLAPVPNQSGWFQRKEEVPAYAWPAWLRGWKLEFWGSLNLEEGRLIGERLDALLAGAGRRLLHLHSGQATSPAERPDLRPMQSPPDSLEKAFLVDLASSLSPESQLLWALECGVPPHLKGLVCKPEHLAGAARGVAEAGRLPVLALSAGQIGKALPNLLEGLPAGCCLLILEAGLVWESAQNHLAPSRLRDLALLRQIHGLALTCPADLEEARQILQLSFETETPIAIRLSQAPAVHTSLGSVSVQAGRAHCLRQGNKVAILALGPLVYAALLAAESLASWGVECQVWDVRFVKPLDREAVKEACKCGFLLTVEEHCLQGGLATTLMETLSQLQESPRVAHLALPPSPPLARETTPESLGLDADGVQRAVRDLLGLASHLVEEG